MANVRVGINGFGRIGRLAFRQMFDAKGYEVVAINDLTDAKMLAHLLKYDSAQGRYKYADQVSYEVYEDAGDKQPKGALIVNGKKINIYAEKDAANIPWKKNKVDVVLECTGFYTSKAKSEAHLKACRKRSSHRRLQRKPERSHRRGQDHFGCFLHDELPRSDGLQPQ